MLSRKKSKGWTLVKPLLVLPLIAVLLLAFAEAKVVYEPGPDAAVSQTKSASNTQAQQMSEEEFIKALKQKSAKIEQLKKENAAKVEELVAALDNATDGDKARLKEELKAAKITSLELDRNSLTLQMKKLEFSLDRETDPTKIQKMKEMMAECKTKDEELAQKLALVKPAEKDGDAKKGTKKK